MSRVRQKHTAAEDAIARALRRSGFAYRRNVSSLPGSPDFANKTHRWAIFVNGCYWHNHTACRRATIPKTNRDFWLEKFYQNRRRDVRKIKAIRALGYRVLLIWECELINMEKCEQRLTLRLPTSKSRSRLPIVAITCIGKSGRDDERPGPEYDC